MARTKAAHAPAPAPAPTKPAKSLQNCIIAFATPRLPAKVLNGRTLSQTKSEIVDHGGSTTNSVDKSVGCTHLVVNQSQFTKQTGNVADAMNNNEVSIVTFEWLEAAFLDDKHVDEVPFLLYSHLTQNKNGASASQSTSPSKPAKPTKRGRGKADDDDDDDDDSPSKKKKAKTEATDVDDEMQKNGQRVKSGSLTIPLDEGVPNQAYRVYVSDDSMIYDVILNQANSDNNNNKFYRIQLLQSSTDNSFWCWTRWGRVGERGQNKMLGDGGWELAIREFNSKFKAKHGNSWEDRHKPQRKTGYTYIERNYDESDDETDEQNSPVKRRASNHENKQVVESKMPEAVQQLMKLIFNQDYFASTFAALNYDAEKMPLGKLSKRTLLRGYEVLKELAALAGQNDEGVKDKSNAYFSLIPHAFGRGRPPVLNQMSDIKREIELLETLTDMQLATDIMKDAKGGKNQQTEELHLLDRQFAGLGMQEMSPLCHKSNEFTELATYLTKSGGYTHALKYKVQDIFRIERQGEHARFDHSKYAKIQNTDRRLLWHGSRCTNFGGILSQGLRIAPPEAPVSGYMFGKGVYLADMSSKSANYCCAHNSGNIALLLLCEAELGKPPLKLTSADYNAGERAIGAGSISTWGVGQTAPQGWKDAGCVHESLRGVLIPDVTTKPPGLTHELNAGLQYNEFIVYDVAQIKLRYLLRVEIH